MVDRLATTELISRETNPVSRRELMVTLTDIGARVVDEVTRRRRSEIAGIVSRMPPDTRRGLIHALPAFATAGYDVSAVVVGMSDSVV